MDGSPAQAGETIGVEDEDLPNHPLRHHPRLCRHGRDPPALAQDGDIVVSGPYDTLPDGRLLSSQVVSYADLDLSLSSDRLELRHRITSTARGVCNTLRRHSDYISLSNDCENGAISSALTQVRTAESDWAVRP